MSVNSLHAMKPSYNVIPFLFRSQSTQLLSWSTARHIDCCATALPYLLSSRTGELLLREKILIVRSSRRQAEQGWEFFSTNGGGVIVMRFWNVNEGQ